MTVDEQLARLFGGQKGKFERAWKKYVHSYHEYNSLLNEFSMASTKIVFAYHNYSPFL